MEANTQISQVLGLYLNRSTILKHTETHFLFPATAFQNGNNNGYGNIAPQQQQHQLQQQARQQQGQRAPDYERNQRGQEDVLPRIQQAGRQEPPQQGVRFRDGNRNAQIEAAAAAAEQVNRAKIKPIKNLPDYYQEVGWGYSTVLSLAPVTRECLEVTETREGNLILTIAASQPAKTSDLLLPQQFPGVETVLQ